MNEYESKMIVKHLNKYLICINPNINNRNYSKDPFHLVYLKINFIMFIKSIKQIQNSIQKQKQRIRFIQFSSLLFRNDISFLSNRRDQSWIASSACSKIILSWSPKQFNCLL